MSAAAIYELVMPFSSADLSNFRYEQSADVMIFGTLNKPLKRLRRFDHDNWIIDNAPIGAVAPYPDGVAVVATIDHDDPVEDGYVPQDYNYAVTVVDGLTGAESRRSNVEDATNDLSIKGNYNTISWDEVDG